MLQEQWLPIPNWEDFYEVSNYGRARNRKTKKLKPHDINNYGYCRVQCYNGKIRQKFFVHKLVAQLFLDGFSEDLVVNHKDGDKTNNMYSNLEWVTRSYNNNKHAFVLGLKEGKKINTPCVLVTRDGTSIFFDTIVDCGKSIGICEKRLHHLIKTQNGFIPEINATISKCVSND